MMAKFSQIMQSSMVKIIGNNKQISDLMSAYNNELTATVTKRFKESVSEAKTVMNKA
jgi:predicted house-cleaning noncanonical NTP pyrophosphatase (MazG superfamily)